MRDATVSSLSRDFLVPVGGVSPGIHANQGVHPVTDGAVSSVKATQQTAEYAHMGLYVDKVNKIVVTPTTASLAVGATQQLVSTATLIDGTATSIVTGDTVWTSADVTKATVNAAGLVTGVGAVASVVITGTYKGSTAASTITVTGP